MLIYSYIYSMQFNDCIPYIVDSATSAGFTWAFRVVRGKLIVSRLQQLTQVNSAFHPSGVGKSSSGPDWG